MSIKAIAVFCGSKLGENPLYEEHTRTLGKLLAEKNIAVVYGGGNRGLMGAVANSVLENEGTVTGIIPELLQTQETLHESLTETHVVDGMHSRKKMIYDRCDAAIILPGGYGTLDEVFEMLTWNQLKIHSKQVFILNTAGFYNHLIAHMAHLHDEGFLYNHPNDQFTVINEPTALLKYL